MAKKNRLVWTDDVMSFLCKRCNEMYPDEPCEPSDCLMLEELDKCKTVDAVEVVHGKWELHGNDDDCGCSYFCSNCHNSYDEDWFYMHGQYRHFKYCPNCGAKMDGDGNV